MTRLRAWLWRRLVVLADRIAPEQAFRCSSFSFTFERGVGAVLHTDGSRGCPLWYSTPDYLRAHDEAEHDWRDAWVGPVVEQVGSWYEISDDGKVTWHPFPTREAATMSVEPESCPTEQGEDEAEPKLASLVGVPEGVGPRVRPDCPICSGGRGLPCAWHALT